jgi:BNR/Asp-box repeat protein
VNPFGLIRSTDGGKTWQKLGLEGETDFHLLATGWNTGAIYVWNPAPSSRIPRAGLHYTVDDGATWTAAAGTGLNGDPQALAVHPDDVRTVAVATANGVFLSRDSGGNFAPITTNGEGLSVHFDLDGARLWYGTFDGAAQLSIAPLSGGKSTSIKFPALGRDGVAYIAQNPVTRAQYAIATFRRSVYVSKDKGRTWTQAAHNGEAK